MHGMANTVTTVAVDDAECAAEFLLSLAGCGLQRMRDVSELVARDHRGNTGR